MSHAAWRTAGTVAHNVPLSVWYGTVFRPCVTACRPEIEIVARFNCTLAQSFTRLQRCCKFRLDRDRKRCTAPADLDHFFSINHSALPTFQPYQGPQSMMPRLTPQQRSSKHHATAESCQNAKLSSKAHCTWVLLQLSLQLSAAAGP
eukprot:2179452-Amphidinium_carterae.1